RVREESSFFVLLGPCGLDASRSIIALNRGLSTRNARHPVAGPWPLCYNNHHPPGVAIRHRRGGPDMIRAALPRVPSQGGSSPVLLMSLALGRVLSDAVTSRGDRPASR